jgi:2-keto-4-pentenoate hydratase/2-oxohepta-3-ene-1,7-dioic acid hydratase in catechol pathway
MTPVKLANVCIDGRPTVAAVLPEGLFDLGRRLPGLSGMKDIVTPDGLAAARRILGERPDHAIGAATFLPVVDNPARIFCVGMNYADKRVEFAETNPAPTLFLRLPHSQTGHGRAVIRPAPTREFDYEGELAVIIGRPGFRVAAEAALDHVVGYSCYMDGSVRDWQHTWYTAGKNWRETGAFGPWLVTADEIPDPHALKIATWLNGRQVQGDSTANMIHRIPDLIAYISTFSPLEPGDVIITGSPGGVGKKRTPPLFLKDGDLIEVEIEGIGRLSNRIADETAAHIDLAHGGRVVMAAMG